MRRAVVVAFVGCATAPPARTANLELGTTPTVPTAPQLTAHDVTDDALTALLANDFNRVAASFGANGPTAAQVATVWHTKTAGLGAARRYRITDRTYQDGFATRIAIVELEHGALEVLVTIDAEKIASLFITVPAPPAHYVDPTRFHDVPLTIGTSFKLPATLTLPITPHRVPGVVLVHGSGPNDRDETVGANKILKDLAEGLASNGIAVLRYEKRTFAYGDQLTNTLTLDDEVIDDAIAAAHTLAARPEIDRVYIVGHSLGAMLAPEIARRAGNTSGIVLLAPPARPPWDIVRDQMAYLHAPRELRAQVERTIVAMTFGGGDGTQLLGMPYSYWADWARRDGIAAAKQLGAPILVMHGDRDYQVTDEDFALWRTGLAGVRDAEVVALHGDNHLFISGHGAPGPLEYKVPGHVDERVVRAIVGFIARGSPSRGSARSSAGAASIAAVHPAGDLRRGAIRRIAATSYRP